MDAVLQTKRLLLRRARLSDRDAYLELRNSPYVMDCNPMAPITPEQAERQLEKDQASGRAFYLEERATGLLAGVVWLSPDSLRYQVESLSLEYFVGEAFAGQGLMTEALGAVVPYAFQTLGAPVLSARVFRENKASQRVLEKLGFTRGGCCAGRCGAQGARCTTTSPSRCCGRSGRRHNGNERGEGLWNGKRGKAASMSF